MYAMDRAVHTEHSSEPRRARREVWRFRRSAPRASEPMPGDADDSLFVGAGTADFTD